MNISTDLYNKLVARFPSLSMGTQTAESTADPEEARLFTFEYVEQDHELGTVTVSLLAPGTLEIIYSRGITDAVKDTDNWFDFLHSMRRFSVRNALDFEVQDISKPALSQQDLETRSQRATPPVVGEGRMWGSRKTSYQKLPAVKLIVRHTSPVDTERRGARSRRIHKIFAETAVGERFLLPTTSVPVARVYAQHIAAGGKPWDSIAEHITRLAEQPQGRAQVKRACTAPGYQALIAAIQEENNNMELQLTEDPADDLLVASADYARPADMLAAVMALIARRSTNPQVVEFAQNYTQDTAGAIDLARQWIASVQEGQSVETTQPPAQDPSGEFDQWTHWVTESAEAAGALQNLALDMTGEDQEDVVRIALMIKDGAEIEDIRREILDLDTAPREEILRTIDDFDSDFLAMLFPVDHEESYYAVMRENPAAPRDPSKSGGSGYDLYHKDFSSAMQHAYDYAKNKLGVDIDPQEIDHKVASGPRKPSAGKTNIYRLMDKDGKKAVQIQVANLDDKKFELNMYKESVEMNEAKSKEQQIADLEKMLGRISGNTASVRMKKFALQKKIDKLKNEEVELDDDEFHKGMHVKLGGDPDKFVPHRNRPTTGDHVELKVPKRYRKAQDVIIKMFAKLTGIDPSKLDVDYTTGSRTVMIDGETPHPSILSALNGTLDKLDTGEITGLYEAFTTAIALEPSLGDEYKTAVDIISKYRPQGVTAEPEKMDDHYEIVVDGPAKAMRELEREIRAAGVRMRATEDAEAVISDVDEDDEIVLGNVEVDGTPVEKFVLYPMGGGVDAFGKTFNSMEDMLKYAEQQHGGVAEAVEDLEEDNAFNTAAAEAALADKKEFEFNGKTYPVKMSKEAARKLVGENLDHDSALDHIKQLAGLLR